MFPAGDQKRRSAGFLSKFLSSEYRPLCFEPIVYSVTSIRCEPPSPTTHAKRSPFGSHAKATMTLSLSNSFTSIGTSLSSTRKSSNAELSVFLLFECLSTLTQRKWPCGCHVSRMSATLNRFFWRISVREAAPSARPSPAG